MQPYSIPCAFALSIAIALLLGVTTNGIEIRHTDNSAKNIDARKQVSKNNVSPGENDKQFWNNVGNDLLRNKLNLERKYGQAKNVIFFIGDGMSIATLTSARIYMGQQENNTGENEMLSFEKFPYTGLSKTYCVDSQVADSACSASAYLTGVKGNIETIGVSGAVSNRDCLASNDPANQAVSSMMWAQKAGKRTGVVSNMRVTHATPAGAYANIAQRDWECDHDIITDTLAEKLCATESLDIARQLIEKETGRNLNVIMGGGRQKFLPNTNKDQKGQRRDGKDLIKEWLEINRTYGASSAYIADRSQLKSLNTSETDYLLGLFATSHMSYNLLADKLVEPTLVEMTEAAIKVLSKGNAGYYLFVEGGLIDWAHHSNLAHLAIDETVMLSKAVARARELTSSDDTLIVVTSDHSHTMTINGYPYRGSNILGHPQIASTDNMPYSTLSYANGPSARERYNLTDDNTDQPTYQFPSMVNLAMETHGGEDVGVFASGPWAHLFVGNYEQNYIPYAISYAAKMGPGAEFERKHEENADSSSTKISVGSSFLQSVSLTTFTALIALLLQ
ncbi:membrane-bound alkaline phosphatase-like [Melanaphis sacchari]|uniref:alkaline phosphatase n=1 Tax=Melanaphis sacchari TaxID=742174 RepID=A0A2H8TVQ6_9HEMI|nr:membrane-bound alkaline phosphatase-like [Melanaphis sacchari]